MRRLPKGVQAQAPSDGAQASPQRRETISVLQMPQAILALGILQPAHEPPILVLQTVQGLGGSPRTLPGPSSSRDLST